MKKICKLLSLAALSALTLVACSMDDDNGGTVDPYANIRPGLAIYNAGVVQNSVAADPATVAIRLAMLLEEAADQEKKIDELEVIFRKNKVSLKALLLGGDTKVEESEETQGDYLIRFVPSSTAILDPCRRDGSYLVRTGGVALSAATEAEAWQVEVASDIMYLHTGSQYTSSSFRLTDGETRLWRQEDGVYRFDLNGMAACFTVATQFVSDWSGSFCWGPSTESDNLTYKDHAEDSYKFYGNARGNSFYAFNNRSATRMSYQVNETSALVYEPAKTVNASNPTGGTEMIVLTDPSDYAAADYPAAAVQAVYSVENNLIYTKLHYNGFSQTL